MTFTFENMVQMHNQHKAEDMLLKAQNAILSLQADNTTLQDKLDSALAVIGILRGDVETYHRDMLKAADQILILQNLEDKSARAIAALQQELSDKEAAYIALLQEADSMILG